MTIPSIVELLEAGVHFGHQKSRWHPKMKPYIFAERHGVHIIDLEKTQKKLEEVLPQAKAMAAEGKQILFVTTKPQARAIVKQAAIDCGMPYLVDRWLGGMLTNFVEIRRLIKKYVTLKDEQATGELEKYKKKERVRIGKDIEKMDGYLIGLTMVDKMPDALFVPAVQCEKTAMVEANKTKVPVIGFCDTNANPEKVAYMVPANDDAVKAITLMVNLMSLAIQEGKKEWDQKQLAEKSLNQKKKQEKAGVDTYQGKEIANQE